MNTTNTKSTLLMPNSPNNFNITLKTSKDRNSKYRMQPINIQRILYPKKENM